MGTDSYIPKITNSDCLQVLRNKYSTDNFKLLNYQQLTLDEMNGYLGDHSMLVIEVDLQHSKEILKLFVKSLPHVQSQRNFLLDFNGFFKEKQFFTKYQIQLRQYSIDLLEDVIPDCLLVNDELFIFEDLTSKGFQTLPSRVPLKVDYIKAALTTLAKLHSSGLILEELKSFKLADEFEEELQESFYSGSECTDQAMKSCKDGLKTLIDLAYTEEKQLSKEVFLWKIVEGCDLQKFFSKPSTRFRNTICHSDAWTKNFMFKIEEGVIKCVVVDFQTYRYGPPAQDVLGFIHLVSDKQTRRHHMKELLQFYYNQLRNNFQKFGVGEVVSEKEFFESCEFYKRFALTQNLTHFQVVIMRDDMAKELFSDQERTMQVLFGDKRNELIEEAWTKDLVFREKNLEVIEELREFYEEQLLQKEVSNK